VGSAEDDAHDQVLDSVLVGPVTPGPFRFVFQARRGRGALLAANEGFESAAHAAAAAADARRGGRAPGGPAQVAEHPAGRHPWCDRHPADLRLQQPGAFAER
jgi:hypothetical protein